MGILLGAHFFMLKLEVLLCLLIILLHECIKKVCSAKHHRLFKFLSCSEITQLQLLRYQ